MALDVIIKKGMSSSLFEIGVKYVSIILGINTNIMISLNEVEMKRLVGRRIYSII